MLRTLLTIAAIGLSSAPASSAVYNFSFDAPASSLHGGGTYLDFRPKIGAITIAPGDVLDVTVNLPAGRKALFPTHYSAFVGTSADGDNDTRFDFFKSTWTAEFIGASGPSPFAMSGQGSTQYGLAGLIAGDVFIGKGFSFTGFHEAFTFVSGPAFRLSAFTFVMGSVPEPATWAMMILGFGAAGAAARRRRPLARTGA